MPTYTTLVALMLVVSNVSPALSAPIRQVREQSLNRRAASAAVAEEVGAAGKKSWLPAFKKYGKQFLIGTGATMAFSYAFEKLNGGGSSKEGSTHSTPPVIDSSNTPPNTANTGNNPNSQAYPTYPTYPTYPAYPTSTNPTYSTTTSPTDPNYSTSNYPTYSTSTSPTDPNYSTSNYPTYSTTQTQNGYQQRAVDRDLPADIFEPRSPSNNNNQNRQTASLDPLGRADLVEAIRLFSRMLDELD